MLIGLGPGNQLNGGELIRSKGGVNGNMSI